MTTETDQPETKRNLVTEFITASGFGPPPEVCRQQELPSPENERNIVDEFITAAGFGLKRG